MNLGTDIGAIPDLTWQVREGFANLREALLRRLITPRGALWYAPNYGLDLRQYVNEALTLEVLEEVRILVEQECEKDSRVLLAQAEVHPEPQNRLVVRVRAETDAGSVELVARVDRVRLEVLNAYPG